MRIALVCLLLIGCGSPELVPVDTVPPVMTMPKPDEKQPRADGKLEAWAKERALPFPRANHCAAAVGDFLIVAGGNYKPAGATEFTTLDDVQIARVASDGLLLPWRRAGSLPAPAIDCVLAVQGSTLVLLGGLFSDNLLNSRVWTASLSAEGSLSEWTEVGALPYGRRALSGGALYQGTKLWLTDGRLPSEGPAEAVLATATLGTALSTWTTTKYAPTFRGKPQVAFTDDSVFIIGGYGDLNAVQTSVTGIVLTEGEQPAETTALPGGRTFGAAATADGWVFLTGGRTQIFGTNPLPTTFAAKATGAKLGPWTAVEPLPEGRSNHTATIVGNHLFVVGGGAGAGGLDTVYRSRVKRVPVAQ